MRPTTNIIHKVLALVLTIAALTAWQSAAQAQQTPATFPVEVTFRGQMANRKYAYTIFSNLHEPYNSGVQDVKEKDGIVYIDKFFDIGSAAVPLTMHVNSSFTFGTSMGDITATAYQNFISFTSGKLYIMGTAVSTNDGTPASFEIIESTNFLRTIRLTDTTFGKVTLTMATHTPFEYAASINGIEATYLDDGINHPVPTVTYKEFDNSTPITLTEGVDYTVSYNVGSTSGTVTVTGLGQYTGSTRKTYSIRQPNLGDFHQLGDGSYEIATTDDLDRLAKYVSNGNNCKDVTFRQTADIAYTYKYAWDYYS